ncbi:DinB family protein [Pedobacter glucosidilyticus]|uniref:DinB family protein n=1 Tax=Pedobacter glucosidilyticus TaxID=1122941 RepID=UPI0026EB232E|nr:DinB family protein [Pedobacter glucosidilyticus]
MKPFFKELFDYNHYANTKLGSVYNEYPDKLSEKAVKLYNHILNAHQIWNNRINPLQSSFGVWEIHPINDLSNINATNHQQTLQILDDFDFHIIISYKTSNGLLFNSSISDILFHVINHSTYHRAQIATEFKSVGLDPINTDYILYKR